MTVRLFGRFFSCYLCTYDGQGVLLECQIGPGNVRPGGILEDCIYPGRRGVLVLKTWKIYGMTARESIVLRYGTQASFNHVCIVV